MKYILGHQNPDTDAYASAVVYASYLAARGESVQAIALGLPNNETRFVFASAKVDLPPVMQTLPPGSELVLVDHNEAGQSITDRDQYTITTVIDHHKVADFSTPTPLQMRVEPVGCTCTILWEMFGVEGYTPSVEMATLMLSAIISDTLYFRSPTTTDRDRAAVQALAQLAQLADPEAYSLQMFKAKSDLGDMSPEQIIMIDYKEFVFGTVKMGIGVMETTDPDYAFGRKAELLAAMSSLKGKNQVDHILFCVVDILRETNVCFVTDAGEAEIVSAVFGVDVVDHQAPLGHILSRKKQLVPMLEKYFGG